MPSKFEYMIFNMSQAEKRSVKWLTLLNEYGKEGWEVVCQLTKGSFLMKKKITST